MLHFVVAALVPLAAAQWLWSHDTNSLLIVALHQLQVNTVLTDMKDLLSLVSSEWRYIFAVVLVFRYYRIVIHTVAYLFWYEHCPIPEYPTVTTRNVHVIIPTVDPENADFARCVLSVLSHAPAQLTVVTANADITRRVRVVFTNLNIAPYSTAIRVMTGPMANKRHQLTHVLNDLARNADANKDTILVFVDDHVWWPSPNFLLYLLAPFEDTQVGIVATNKRVQRERGKTFTESFLNFIACIYLERHNFEMTATNAIDGGVFVVSGRTCAVRASVVMRQDFRDGFTNERFFFNKLGPLNPDDDNYITRFMVRNNIKIKVQNMGAETLMETTLGTSGGYKKFRGQILRWARSQWRSNSASLFTDRSVWTRQPWSVHAIFIAWFWNFALLADGLVFYLWHKSDFPNITIYPLLAAVWGSKLIKLLPFFWRNPQDLWLFPAYVLFAYFHSFVKFWTLITFYDHSWGGRDLKSIGMGDSHHDNDDDDDGNNNDDGNDDTDKCDSTDKAAKFPTPSRASNSSHYSSGDDHNSKVLGAIRSSVQHYDPLNSAVAQWGSAWSQTSRSRSRSSGGSFNQSGHFNVPSSRTSRTSSISSTNTMLNKYGKLQAGERANGFTPEGSFTTRHQYQTPWGGVTTKSPQTYPANIRQSQSPSLRDSASPTPSSSPQTSKKTSVTNAVRMPPTPPPSSSVTKTIPLSVFNVILDNIPEAKTLDFADSLGSLDDEMNFVDPFSDANVSSDNTSKALGMTTASAPSAANESSQVLDQMKSKHQYIRDFSRGHDCRRIHADGTQLRISKRYSGLKCCQTPSMKCLPAGHVVPGRPRF